MLFVLYVTYFYYAGEFVSTMRQSQQENMTEGCCIYINFDDYFNINFCVLVPVPDELIKELADLRIAFAEFLCVYKSELKKSDEAQRKFVETLQILLVDGRLDFSKCFESLIEKEVTLFNITYMEKLCKIFPENVR